jgi:CheY-like chemotaxis protein
VRNLHEGAVYPTDAVMCGSYICQFLRGHFYAMIVAMSAACKKTLCIEDDRGIAALPVEELTERGFQVSLARDGDEGFDAILKDLSDLVLADIDGPAVPGFETIERLTLIMGLCRDIPFTCVTALTDRDNQNRRGLYLVLDNV